MNNAHPIPLCIFRSPCAIIVLVEDSHHIRIFVPQQVLGIKLSINGENQHPTLAIRNIYHTVRLHELHETIYTLEAITHTHKKSTAPG